VNVWTIRFIVWIAEASLQDTADSGVIAQWKWL
jgi:hypothetical protein